MMSDSSHKPYALSGARAGVEGGYKPGNDDPFYTGLSDQLADVQWVAQGEGEDARLRGVPGEGEGPPEGGGRPDVQRIVRIRLDFEGEQDSRWDFETSGAAIEIGANQGARSRAFPIVEGGEPD